MRTLVRLSLAFLVLAASTPVFGQSVTEMAGKKFADGYVERDQQIVNGVKAVEEALKGLATSGETVRGATGPLSSLLIESDTIICASWLLAFERTMTDMAVRGAFNSDAGSALFKAMQDLKNRVEVACQGVLNDNPPGNDGPTDQGGQTTPGECCAAEKLALETAQYRLEHAEWEAARADARTDFAYELASTRPEIYSQFFVSTPQELEREQNAKDDAVERARAARDSAQRTYERCLAACQTQTSFFDTNRNKILVAAAAVGVATVAMIGGGGGTPTAFVSTPAPTPIAQTPVAPPVVNTPAPTPPPAPPTLLSLVLGRWICDACRVLADADRHENTLRFCIQLVATFQMLANSPMRIEHPAPWITPTGELDEASGGYRGTGSGPVGSFSNVSSTVTATFQRSGDAVTAVDLTVTLGENGAFPGGRPVSYAVRLRKTP